MNHTLDDNRIRSRFCNPSGMTYLDGNSLGLLCEPAELSLNTAIEAWRNRAILGWTEGSEPWFEMSRAVSAKLAPLLGTESAHVAVGQSTTINLHQLLASFYNPAIRPNIVIDATSFPTDRYAVVSHLTLRGRNAKDNLVVVPSTDGLTLSEENILAALTADVGFAVLPAVVYTSGQLLDMANITAVARKSGILIAWDCSHSAGIVPHHFARDDVDLAFGCGYKYLNGGPGAAAWLYVHPRHAAIGPGLAGWFGCDPARQFDMATEFMPANDASRFLAGTPHVFSLAPLLGSLELINEMGIEAIRKQSLAFTMHLRSGITSKLTRFGVRTITPQNDAERGGHITIAHPDAGPLSAALRARSIIPDFRPPQLLRLCPSPLYNTKVHCGRAVSTLEELLETRIFEREEKRSSRVT